MGRLFSEDGLGLTADHGSPSEVAACLGRAYEAWRAPCEAALLPEPAAMEGFARTRVLAELSGAFAVAERHHHALRADPRHVSGVAIAERAG
jgi:hypothetical protein